MTKATHILTIVEPVDFVQLAKEQAREKSAGKKLTAEEIEEIEQLDWSLSLLIACTSFGFEELLKQLKQAKRLYCTETEAKILKILKENYSASYRFHLEENQSDHSGASNQDNR